MHLLHIFPWWLLLAILSKWEEIGVAWIGWGGEAHLCAQAFRKESDQQSVFGASTVKVQGFHCQIPCYGTYQLGGEVGLCKVDDKAGDKADARRPHTFSHQQTESENI